MTVFGSLSWGMPRISNAVSIVFMAVLLLQKFINGLAASNSVRAKLASLRIGEPCVVVDREVNEWLTV